MLLHQKLKGSRTQLWGIGYGLAVLIVMSVFGDKIHPAMFILLTSLFGIGSFLFILIGVME